MPEFFGDAALPVPPPVISAYFPSTDNVIADSARDVNFGIIGIKE